MAKIQNPTIARSKKMTPEVVDQITWIIQDWPEDKITWEAVIAATRKKLGPGYEYTRAALHKKDVILLAFQVKKGLLGEKPPSDQESTGNKRLDEALRKIDRLEAEIERLSRENNALLEQFIRWRYNAHNRGLTMEYLNEPLPASLQKSSEKPGKPVSLAKTKSNKP